MEYWIKMPETHCKCLVFSCPIDEKNIANNHTKAMIIIAWNKNTI